MIYFSSAELLHDNLLSDHAALIDYVINRYILICSSEVGFLCRHNAVYSYAILLPARRVGTKRALSDAILHDNYLTICLLCTTRDATICLLCILNFPAFQYYTPF